MKSVAFILPFLLLGAAAEAQLPQESYVPLQIHTAYPDYYPCQAEEDGKWGYVNKNNEWAISPLYDGALYETNGGMYAVSLNGKWGFVGASGEPLTTIDYDAAVCEIDYKKGGYPVNFAALRKKGKWAFVDVQGRFVTEFKYDEVLILNGQYIIRMKDPTRKGKMISGHLNNDGKEVWDK
ncbi:MAG: WG repeat-containing protein [Bacteroidales bacterium]|nr:WG repeat-containing protein [Bacteroidales bacterium]